MKTENLMITIEDYQKDNPNDKREDYEIAKELIFWLCKIIING